MAEVSDRIAQKLCEKWGLDVGKVSRIHIDLEVGNVAVTVVEMFPNAEMLEDMVEIVTEYSLVEKE